MDPQQCFDTYGLTIPTMLTVTGIGVSIGLAVRYLKVAHPITFTMMAIRVHEHTSVPWIASRSVTCSICSDWYWALQVLLSH